MPNSKNERFKTISAALVLLSRNGKEGMEYLLQKRQNTGFSDGMWDFSASGHVEKDEAMTATVCREAKEEICIDIKPEAIEFMGLIHDFGEDGIPRFLGCFKVGEYSGEIKIGEPEKISELRWFSEDSLPNNMIDTRRKAIEQFRRNGRFYEEFGWDK